METNIPQTTSICLNSPPFKILRNKHAYTLQIPPVIFQLIVICKVFSIFYVLIQIQLGHSYFSTFLDSLDVAGFFLTLYL